jgi:biopolymer transport protein ExbB
MSLPVTDAVQGATSAISFDLVSMWHSMGILAKLVAGALAVMSVYSLGVIAERAFALWRGRRASRAFARELPGLLAEAKLDEAIDLSEKLRHGYLARVLGSGLVEHKQGNTPMAAAKGHELAGYDVMAAVNRAIERHSLRVVTELRRGLGGLATIASAAPFVGLLGTVGGIITAFQAMAATGSGGLGSVSAGIAEALVTTAFGLFVAIPAVMMFNYFTHRLESIQVDITESAGELVDYLLKRSPATPAPTQGRSRKAWDGAPLPSASAADGSESALPE